MRIIGPLILPSVRSGRERIAPISEEEIKDADRTADLLLKMILCIPFLPVVAIAIAAAAYKFFPPEYVVRDAKKAQHVMRAPQETEAYFQTLNKISGYNCEVQFQEGKKYNGDFLYSYPSVQTLGECARIAFRANQDRKPSDRGISFELNASAKMNSYVGRGICDFREKTALPYCYTTTYTDKYFLEHK